VVMGRINVLEPRPARQQTMRDRKKSGTEKEHSIDAPKRGKKGKPLRGVAAEHRGGKKVMYANRDPEKNRRRSTPQSRKLFISNANGWGSICWASQRNKRNRISKDSGENEARCNRHAQPPTCAAKVGNTSPEDRYTRVKGVRRKRYTKRQKRGQGLDTPGAERMDSASHNRRSDAKVAI